MRAFQCIAWLADFHGMTPLDKVELALQKGALFDPWRTFANGTNQTHNEAGKGDHRHVRDKEQVYRFKTTEQLLADFWKDVEEMLK